MNHIQLANLAHTLADRACIADIECNAVLGATSEPGTWYDTSPMLDRNEQPDDAIEMNLQALAYAELRRLFDRHPTQPHLVRIREPKP